MIRQSALDSQGSFEKYALRGLQKELPARATDNVVPWRELEALIEQHYTNARGTVYYSPTHHQHELFSEE